MIPTHLRTAYMLQVHKDPNQVNKFIQQLISEGQADVYVHIDLKAYEQMYDKIVKSPNVKVLQESICCEWGDISQVDATILLIKAVVASKNKYDFVCLRSGQDLLVKNGFKEFLVNNQNKIFMTVRNETISRQNLGLMEIKWPKVMRRRYTSAHPFRIYRRILQSLYRKGINIYPNTKSWPKEYSFYCGAQWFSIPFEVAKYIHEFLETNEWYHKFFENSLIPDNWFFQTLIMNSPYKTEVVNDNLMFLNWGQTLSERNSPQNVTSNDIQLIEGTEKFFARKFDESIDESVVNYFSNKISFGETKLISKV